VAIIDDADFLTIESANCLLKTLEEPPPGAVLILIGTSRSRQLPTILSRTQIMRFRPLSSEVLRRLLLEQKIVTDETRASVLAEQCDGSLARAAELADPELQSFEQRLLPQFAPARFDSGRLAAELSEYINQAGKEADARRRRLRLVFQLVGGLFRHVMRVSCGAEAEGLSTRDQAAEGLFPPGPATQCCALAALDRCLEAEVQLDRNANQATLLECWLDDLAGIMSSYAAVPTARI